MEAKNTESKDVKTNEEGPEKITRLVVTKDAEAAVSSVMDAVNYGFDAGRATKVDVASYMLLWFKNNAPDGAKLALRTTLANEMTMLESVVRKAKTSGSLPPALREALAQHFFGNDGAVSKKLKKGLRSEGITDRHGESEAA